MARTKGCYPLGTSDCSRVHLNRRYGSIDGCRCAQGRARSKAAAALRTRRSVAAPTDDLQPDGQSVRCESARHVRRWQSRHVERITELRPAQPIPGISRPMYGLQAVRGKRGDRDRGRQQQFPFGHEERDADLLEVGHGGHLDKAKRATPRRNRADPRSRASRSRVPPKCRRCPSQAAAPVGSAGVRRAGTGSRPA